MKDIRNKILLGAILGLAVLVGLFLYTDIREARTYLSHFPIQIIGVVLCLALFNYAIRWVKWHYYLGIIGVNEISRVDSAAIFVSGFVLALSPGKVAELLKSAVLKGITGTPITRSAPIIVAERATDGLAMLILGAVGFGGMLLSSSEAQTHLMRYLPAYLTILGLLIAGVVVIQIRPLCLWFLERLKSIPLVKRISQPLAELYQSSFELFRPGPLLLSITLGVISWSGECLAFYLILRGMGLAPSWLLLWQATFVFASASIIGAVSGLPGGLGAAEVSIAGMVQLLVLGHEDAGFAGTATIIARLSTLWFAVVLGLVTAVVFRHRLFPAQAGPSARPTEAESQLPG